MFVAVLSMRTWDELPRKSFYRMRTASDTCFDRLPCVSLSHEEFSGQIFTKLFFLFSVRRRSCVTSPLLNLFERSLTNSKKVKRLFKNLRYVFAFRGILQHVVVVVGFR